MISQNITEVFNRTMMDINISFDVLHNITFETATFLFLLCMYCIEEVYSLATSIVFYLIMSTANCIVTLQSHILQQVTGRC